MTTDNNSPYSTRAEKSIYLFEKQAENTVRKHNMIECGDCILTALSGGADSVSLLLALISLSKRMNFSVCACHLNHGIRGAEADADEAFARALCEKHGVPFYAEKADIPKLREALGGSVETVARNARYEFFERAASFLGAGKIATAHTISDNAETLLFNICRGASSDGICGIPPVRGRFIRPLIELSRCQVESYLEAQSQDYVTDSTNSDENYTRNFLRHSIVPALKRINPDIENALFRLSDSARGDKSYFESRVKEMFEKPLSVSELSNTDFSLLTRYIRALCEKNFDGKFFISQNRVYAMVDAIREVNAHGGVKKISLTDNGYAEISRGGIVFSGKENETEKTESSFNIPLHWGQNIINSKYAVFISKTENEMPRIIENEEIVYRLYKKTECLSDIIEKGIFARNRISKDKFRMGGISRNLKKVFADKKIPASQRCLVPLICCGQEIAALPLYKVPADNFKPENGNAAIIAFYEAVKTNGKE